MHIRPEVGDELAIIERGLKIGELNVNDRKSAH